MAAPWPRNPARKRTPEEALRSQSDEIFRLVELAGKYDDILTEIEAQCRPVLQFPLTGAEPPPAEVQALAQVVLNIIDRHHREQR